MKFVVIPNNIERLDTYQQKGVTTFMVGLKNYSIHYPELSLEKIKKLSEKVELFVVINKNIFNHELSEIKEILKQLSTFHIKAVLYYDLAVLNIVIENQIEVDLVWHQTHMVTNYNTCNYYYNKGVKYGVLANEITLEEILDIKENTDMKLMVEVFGYPIMSHSQRSLLSNYFKTIDQEKEDRPYTLTEKDNQYLITETVNGTSILLKKLINGTKPLFDFIENNLDYAILDMQEVDIKLSEKVLDQYMYILDNGANISELEKEKIICNMNELIGDNTNFFYKKTIYKVKKETNSDEN
ncbi:MAG: U32 family peptidase [bacterium]|nr:U32 family peptidase [bacterium]